jgi:hypothetical protein
LVAAQQGSRVYQSHLPTDDTEYCQHSNAFDPEYPDHQVHYRSEAAASGSESAAAGVFDVAASSTALPLHRVASK